MDNYFCKKAEQKNFLLLRKTKNLFESCGLETFISFLSQKKSLKSIPWVFIF